MKKILTVALLLVVSASFAQVQVGRTCIGGQTVGMVRPDFPAGLMRQWRWTTYQFSSGATAYWPDDVLGWAAIQSTAGNKPTVAARGLSFASHWLTCNPVAVATMSTFSIVVAGTAAYPWVSGEQAYLENGSNKANVNLEIDVTSTLAYSAGWTAAHGAGIGKWWSSTPGSDPGYSVYIWVFDGAHITGYLNGVQAFQISDSTTWKCYGWGVPDIIGAGTSAGATPAQGIIAGLRIFDHALSAAEIASNVIWGNSL